MKLTLTVTMEDGNQFDVTTSLFTVVAWERKTKRKASELAAAIGVEDLAFLAHHAAINTGIALPIALDDFIKKCTSIEVAGVADANPTEPVHTDEH